VIGIVASRLVEKYHRPAVVIAFKNGQGKGSGRSIKGFDLFKALQVCHQVLGNFGGHAQAVGLTLDQGNMQTFREGMNAFAESFNGRLRDECLNTNWFLSVKHAREIIERWRRDYNNNRPHSSLRYLTPKEYAKKHSEGAIFASNS